MEDYTLPLETSPISKHSNNSMQLRVFKGLTGHKHLNHFANLRTPNFSSISSCPSWSLARHFRHHNVQRVQILGQAVLNDRLIRNREVNSKWLCRIVVQKIGIYSCIDSNRNCCCCWHHGIHCFRYLCNWGSLSQRHQLESSAF